MSDEPPPPQDKSLWIVIAILMFVVPLGFFIYLRLKPPGSSPGLFPQPTNPILLRRDAG